MTKVKISSNIDTTIEEFIRVVLNKEEVNLTDQCIDTLDESHAFLKSFSSNRIIYGVNTGFGPMAQHIIPKESLKDLQYNLIRSHASGMGNSLTDLESRAVSFCRLISLCKGFSGIHKSTAEALTTMLNHGVSAQIFEHGGVGASGDLVQLAHLALALIGEGSSFYNGELKPTKEIFDHLGIKPIEIKMREGLALINGTSTMTALGILNVLHAKNLLKWSVYMSSMLNEITEAYDDHYSVELNSAKKHPHQISIAHQMQELLSDSKLTKNRYTQGENPVENQLKDKMQEYYSIRCVPQILGPIMSTIEQCEKILITEMNSANDNPIVDVKSQSIYHGGNFHGDYISLEMDKLKIAITKLSMLCERQVNFLMNTKINDKLPPFINSGTLGLNFGMQGMQFTATSTTAENQMLSNPMYVHSISTNNDNQDIVSMGTNAASITKKVIENTYQVFAIGIMSTCQAIDQQKIKDKLSSKTRDIFNNVRKHSEFIEEDKARYAEMNDVLTFLKDFF